MVTNQIANHHFESLVALLAACIAFLGLDWTTAFTAANAAYVSSTFYREVIFAISTFLRNRLLSEIGDSVFCILIDETTDSANRNQLIVYIRWVDAKQRKIREEYLGILQLPAGDAETIFDALIKFVRGEGLDIARWVAFGSDGASVMTGCNNGVATKLKEINPYMVTTHCASHRFALVCANSAEHVPYLKLTYEPALISLWAFLNYSSSRWSDLQAHYLLYKKYVFLFCFFVGVICVFVSVCANVKCICRDCV